MTKTFFSNWFILLSILYSLALQGQTLNSKDWQTIDSLERLGFIQEANARLDSFLPYLDQSDLPFEWVRAHLYKARYLDMLQDQPEWKGIYYLEDKLKQANGPSKAVLESNLAKFYFQYAISNAYRIEGRTSIAEGKTDSLEYWTISQFIQRSNILYTNSLQDAKAFSHIVLDSFATLLPALDQKEPLLENLYQVLLHRALSHFFNDQSRLSEPVYVFQPDNPTFFALGEAFASISLDSRDSSSFLYKALRLYQEEFSSISQYPEWLIYLEIMRLKALLSATNLEDKHTLYATSLEQLYQKWKALPISVEIAYHLGTHYLQQGAQFQPLDTATYEFRMLPARALEICNNALTAFPKAQGSTDLRQLIHNITRPEWEWQTENFVLPGERNLVSVRYRNANDASISLYKVSLDQWRAFQQMPFKKQLEFVVSQPIFRNEKVSLQNPGDYQWHRTEYAMDPLDAGIYLVVLDSMSQEERQQRFPYSWIHVSAIEMVTREVEKALDIWIADRKSSCPIPGAEIKVWFQYYNDSKAQLHGPETYYTDKYGRVSVTAKKHARYEIVAFHEGNIVLPRDIHSAYNNEVDDYERVMLFTDRTLYRPGQIVYVKGLCLNQPEKGYPGIVARKKTSLQLMDANGVEISRLQVVSNDFGSFQGSFTLPTGLLNGRFSLVVDGGLGYHSIQVEEYKRPRFYVRLEEPQSDYALGDTVTIAGRADMYAGIPVGEAKGTYRVVRTTFFPWLPWYRPFPKVEKEAIVAVGNVRTDAQGVFSIRFSTPAPRQDTEGWKPIYQYMVQVDLTDAAGETRSATKGITLGSVSLLPIIQKPKSIFNAKGESLEVDIRNLSGITQDIDVEVIVSPIKTPGFRYRKRLWERPDLPQIRDIDFRKWFPSMPWTDENQIQNWPKGTPAFQTSINPAKSKVVPLPPDLDAGLYHIEIKFEEGGQQYVHTDWFSVHDSIKGRWADTGEPFQLQTREEEYQPGDTAVVLIGNPWPQACIYISVEKDGKVVREGWQQIKGMHRFTIPVVEADRGGIFVHAFMVGPDGVHKKSIKIEVPWSNKELQISWETRREFVTPGAEEVWEFTIAGPSKELVASEILASMYDASLDAIGGKHFWSTVLPPHTSARRAFSDDYRSYNRLSSLVWRRFQYLGTDWPRVIPDFLHDIYIPQYFPDVQMEYKINMVDMATRRSGNGAVPAAPVMEATGDDQNNISGNSFSSRVEETVDNPSIQQRQNFNETVFFYPQLRTDSVGNVRVSFTMGDALTRWRLMLFAHNRQLASAYKEFLLETRKEIMVFPNVPRFVKQGDRIELACKVYNNLDETQRIRTNIRIRDLVSGRDLTQEFIFIEANSSFTLLSNESNSWSPIMQVAHDYSGLLEITYAASTEKHQDTEVHIIPVLSNRKLVTESIPLWTVGGDSRTFSLAEWKKKTNQESVVPALFQIEFSSNPAWYALQSMPYIIESPNLSTEQQVGRLYANALGHSLTKKYPVLRSFLDQWEGAGTLQSALEKNAELKSAILTETPWIMESVSETEQLQRLKWLFDDNRLMQEFAQGLKQLFELQSSSGGFPWFPGGRDNTFITQYVLEKLGHLDKQGVQDIRSSAELREIVQKAVSFCDQEAVAYYEKHTGGSNDKNVLIHTFPLHYLYVRSFFPELIMNGKVRKAHTFFLDQASLHFMQLSLEDQAYAAISLYRNMRVDEAKKILKSAVERSVYNEEVGRFWKLGNAWNRNAQALAVQTAWIEAVDEIQGETEVNQQLRRWLLKQKQTTQWTGTMATSRAIYALLATNKNWVDEKTNVQFLLNGQEWKPVQANLSPGSAYFKANVDLSILQSDKPSIAIQSASTHPGWGAVYWQYFEDYDKIERNADTPLRLNRKLYRKVNSEKGEELILLTAEDKLKVGEKLTVRLEWRMDRAMEFVHLKDVRASGLEPIDAQSGYYFNGALGYYKAVRDQAVDFFFDYMAPGTYVVEYDLSAFHAGDFSAGVSTIQSMYAPEFTAHSFGSRITIVK